MIELSKHIESLLLENDCVIVPELGGFIAHYQSAYYEESEGLFLPPIRTVGFNPQLTMNDGLLAQSYMQAYHTDYSDAMCRISGKVNLLKENLYEGDTVEFHGIGSLRYNIYDEYEFQSYESGLLTPSLYGLDSFSMPLLPVELQEELQPSCQPVVAEKELRLNPMRWMGNAVAVAVAVILFFVLSVPVENTYIDKGSYASLGTDCLFDAIRSQSMATSLCTVANEPQISLNKELKPKVVKVEKVAPLVKDQSINPEPSVEAKVEHLSSGQLAVSSKPASKTEISKRVPAPEVATKVPAKKKSIDQKKRYHIIVASLATADDASRMLKEFNGMGYAEAKVMESNGRFRIALCSYSDKGKAYTKLNELKKAETFKSAWMLSSK